MTLQQLRYVIALDNYRHFVTAAEKCFVSQSTLSIQIKKLEDLLSIVIFDRSKHPLEPTPMGEEFIERARLIMRDVEQLSHFISIEKNDLKGDYRIGIIPTLAPYLLPRFIGDFMQQHPDVRLHVEEQQSAELIQNLITGKLDMGLLATPLKETDLREINLFYEPFLLYAEPNHPVLDEQMLHPQNLKADELWLLSQGHCFRNQTVNICDFNDEVSLRRLELAGGSIETLKNIVDGMGGYTLIPELSYNEKAEAEKVKRFAIPQPVREISLVVHKSFAKELLLTNLRRSILAKIPEDFKKNGRFVTVDWR